MPPKEDLMVGKLVLVKFPFTLEPLLEEGTVLTHRLLGESCSFHEVYAYSVETSKMDDLHARANM